MDPTPDGPARLTPAAAARLKRMDEATASPILELYVAGETCCGVRLDLAFADRIDDGYSVTEVDGVRLIVAPDSQAYCVGATVDFVETPDASGFLVNAPAGPGGTCSCGSHHQ